MKTLRSLLLFCVATLTIVMLGSAKRCIPYRHIDNNWELQPAELIDSLTFFTQDTLEFEHDDYHADNTKTVLYLDKDPRLFDLRLTSLSIQGFYQMNRSKKMLILSTCLTPNDDLHSWVVLKSDTFFIQKLNKEELVLTR